MLLTKTPGFTVVAVFTLAVAVGANAVVFGVMNALFLHSLNVPEPDSLYQLERASDKQGNESYLKTENPQPAIFLPILQSPWSETWLVVRSSRDPHQLAAAIRSALRELDAGLPLFIQTWSEEMNGALFASRVAAAALGVLGAMGALLSVTGIFGMAAYTVNKRLKELGIRMALGAQRKEVLLAALGRALKLLVFGSAAGLILGLIASRVLAAIVYQATLRDPVVLAGVVVAMSLLGLVATWIPAQRALSIEPSVLLREE
jgi:hypothetical protein